MATHQPANGRRTRTIPALAPWLVAGVVLVGLVAAGLIVKGHISSSAVLTRCPTPTPTAFATSRGSNEVVCLVQVSGRFDGPRGPGGKPTFINNAYAVYDGHTGNLLITVGMVAKG